MFWASVRVHPFLVARHLTDLVGFSSARSSAAVSFAGDALQQLLNIILNGVVSQSCNKVGSLPFRLAPPFCAVLQPAPGVP